MHIDDKVWTSLLMLMMLDEMTKDNKIVIEPKEVDNAEKMGSMVRKYD